MTVTGWPLFRILPAAVLLALAVGPAIASSPTDARLHVAAAWPAPGTSSGRAAAKPQTRRAIPVMGGSPEGPVVLTPGTIFRDCANCPDMVVVPAGSYMMGDAPGEAERVEVPRRYRGRSEPRHEVEIPAPYAIGRFELRRVDFARFVQDTGRIVQGCWAFSRRGWVFRDELSWVYPGFTQTAQDPVVCVSWDDAQAYTYWLSAQTRQRYRLPTEAEWEWAARAGSATARPWGEEIGRNFANCRGCGSRWDNHRTAPVRSFPENAFYLNDMLGNAAEWVEDCWHETYHQAPGDGSAWTTSPCSFRVFRGGAWLSPPAAVRSAHRDRELPGFRANYLGFRLVREVPPVSTN